MSSTNKTTYLELPIFIGTDTPSWLGDWNNAMNAIDAGVNNANNAAVNAKNAADSAESKADGNTESITAMQSEINTIKKAVQNYDAILNFNQVNLVPSPNNLNLETGGTSYFMVQNTNKTIGKLYFVLVTKQTITNPTSYTYTSDIGTGTWYDLLTVEDNCFNLNQGSLPTSTNCITLGISSKYNSTYTTVSNSYIRAWFDGVTTHIGTVGSSTISDFAGSNIYVLHSCPIFLSGSVYNPDDATT